MKIHEFMVHVAVQLLLIKENKILLMRRANTGYEDGKFATVGGHLEENESLKDALIREVKEEVNVDVDKDKLEFVSVVHKKGKTSNYVNVFFAVNDFSGEIKNNEPDKCTEIKWFSLDKLPKDIIQVEKKVIESLSTKNHLIEYNWN